MTLEWPKWFAMGSKRAHFTCLCTLNGLGSFQENPFFDPFFDLFFVPRQPIFNAFQDFRRAKTAPQDQNGPKTPLAFHVFQDHFWKKSFFCTRWTHFGTHVSRLPLLKNHGFDPYLTLFLSQNSPFSRPLGIFARVETGPHKIKTPQNHLFWHSMCSRLIFEQSLFFLAPRGLY